MREDLSVVMELENLSPGTRWDWWESATPRPPTCQLPPLFYLLYDLTGQGVLPAGRLREIKVSVDRWESFHFRQILRRRLEVGVEGYVWIGRHRGSQLVKVDSTQPLALQVYGLFRDDEQYKGPYAWYYLNTPRVYAGALVLRAVDGELIIHVFPRHWRDDAYQMAVLQKYEPPP